jgi:hypothetical protein
MITIFTTKQYLESPSRQGRAPSPDLELAPRCYPWSLPDNADDWLEPLSWVAGILDADGERLSYQRRDVSQARPRYAQHGVGQAWPRSAQR